MPKQKILIFSNSLKIGGMEKVMVDYANLLNDDGYAITYVVMEKTSKESAADYYKLSDDISFFDLNAGRLRSTIFKLAKIIIQQKPDVVITVNSLVLPASICKVLNPFIRFKIIATQHNLLYNPEIKRARLSSYILKYCSYFCYKIIAVSVAVSNALIKQLKIDPKKVLVLYNPVDRNKIIKLAHEYNVPDSNYVLFVGRLSPVKNILLAIRGFELIANEYPTMSFLIIGDGEERAKLTKRIRASPVRSRIKMLGTINNPYPYILGSSMVVIPSFSEGLSLVCIESLTLGKTVVATPNEGCTELLNRDDCQYGYLAKTFDNSEEFANLMEIAYKHPMPQHTLSEATKCFDKSNKLKEITALLGDS